MVVGEGGTDPAAVGPKRFQDPFRNRGDVFTSCTQSTDRHVPFFPCRADLSAASNAVIKMNYPFRFTAVPFGASCGPD